MDANRFDTLTRLLTVSSSRRRLLRGLAGVPLALAGGRLPGAADAKKKKKKKPKFNTFGCLDVGAACGGKDDRCCSGICQGKKPKKGEKDKRTCAAHHTGGCTHERDLCAATVENFAASRCGPAGADVQCVITTGNASFCADFQTSTHDEFCLSCGKDADCVALGFGPGAACVILDGGTFLCDGPSSCKAHGSSNGTACLPPGV